MIKPVITFSCGFFSSWFTHSDNFIAVKAHEGEAQQLFELVIELPCAWQHPLIMHYKDEFGRLCSIINRHVGRNNPPYNITRDIAVAFMESSDFIYFILYSPSPNEMQWLSKYYVRSTHCIISNKNEL